MADGPNRMVQNSHRERYSKLCKKQKKLKDSFLVLVSPALGAVQTDNLQALEVLQSNRFDFDFRNVLLYSIFHSVYPFWELKYGYFTLEFTN